MRDIVVLAGYFVRCPLGGYAWQILHYLWGLRACGLEPYFYEDTAYYPDCFDPETGNMCSGPETGIDVAARFLGAHGFGENWIFFDAPRDAYFGRSREEAAAVLREARLLVTLAPVNRLPRTVGRTRAFVDIDPGFTQIQAQGDPGLRELLAEHDVHFTLGENIGTPGCAIPCGDVTWHPTRPPVVPALWQPLPADPGAAFTTIGRWDERRRDTVLAGEVYSWCKRVEWLRFLELPALTGARFELAMDVDKTPGDRALLESRGWSIVDPLAVSGDPFVYRDFICGSRGEFTVAKDLNVRLATGWFSDRSVCYLAAGRPVVTQDTGFDRVVPTGEGLFPFRGVEDARDAVRTVEAHFDRHGAAARRLAIEHFSAERVIRDLLGRCRL